MSRALLRGKEVASQFAARSLLLVLVLLATTTRGEDRTWTGASLGSGFWTDAANWGGTAPANNDALFFAGTTRLVSLNNFAVTNSYTGLTFNAGSGPFTLLGTGIALTGGITNNSRLPQTNNLDVQVGNLVVSVTNAGTLILNGVVASTNGSLTKVGAGTLMLNALNTYPGGTTIRQGTIRIPAAGRLGAPGGPLFMDGGTLQIGNLVTLADRAVTLSQGGGTFSLDQISYLTVTNDISGPGALTKTGPGALVLKGVVNSTGPVAVQGGTLYVDGAMSGPGSVTVYSGGTLGGSGFILGDLNIQDGGTLAPGTNDVHGPSTLTANNLTLSPNSILRMDLNVPGVLGGTNDLLLVRGDLTLDGILKISGHGTNGLYPLIKYDGVLTDNGMQIGPAVNGTLIVDTTNRIISLNAVSFPPDPPAPMRLYFIGNSLTFSWDIPGTVAGLAAAANDWFAYNSDLVAGSSLLGHTESPSTIALLDSGAFDIVMLQEYSNRPTIPSDRNNLMYPAARTLDAHIVAHGEKTMFYETWGYPNGDPSNCALYDTPPQYQGCGNVNMSIALRMGYARIANELSAAISPVGLAWLTVQAERPDINLYNNNGLDYHPDPAGSYLSACVHYAAIFGRSPVGNPYLGYLTDASLAAYLQSVAERTVLQDPWAYDPFGFAPNRYYWASRWADYTNRSYSRLSGVVISGNGGLPSPTVKLDAAAATTNNVYLGVFGYNYESAGQGRLFINPGGSLVVTNTLVVGKEGQGSVQQNGGILQVNGVLRLAEQPSASGSYTLAGGSLTASRIAAGLGNASFSFTGGQLSFAKFGAATNAFSLAQAGGTLTPAGAATIYGDYTMSDSAVLALALGNRPNSLNVAGGTANLGGTLSLSYAPGFTPVVGQQFPLVSAGGISGRFRQILKPGLLPNGMMLVVTYTPTSVAATVVTPVPLGLIAWWPGEGNANDLAGAHNGALLGGATATTPGKVGQAFSFDGTNSYVSIPDSPMLRPTNFTIEAWVRFTSLDSAGSGGSPAGDQYIVFKQNTRSSDFEGFDLSKTRVSGGDVFRLLVASATAQTAEIHSTTLLSTGVWYHVAGVRGSNFTQLYVNGHLESQTNVSFPMNYGTNALFFGSSGQSYWDHKFAGLLDEVSLYNCALSADEIAAIYAAGGAGKCREAAVTVQPQSQTVTAGSSVLFAAQAFGPVLRYQWLHNGTNVLAGGTNSTLWLTSLTPSQSGNYSIIASNFAGVVLSEPVSLEVTPLLGIIMPINLSGALGSSWRIDYVNDLGPTNNWTTLATVTLTNITQVYSDSSALTQSHRFYRVVPLP
jgi:autotransporter-associated beta strand protein